MVGHAMQVQSFDQAFEKMNKALLVSCQKGLPVRVVRSYKVGFLA
jgi:E3 ubiquitin-protein ligase UHRF1